MFSETQVPSTTLAASERSFVSGEEDLAPGLVKLCFCLDEDCAELLSSRGLRFISMPSRAPMSAPVDYNALLQLTRHVHGRIGNCVRRFHRMKESQTNMDSYPSCATAATIAAGGAFNRHNWIVLGGARRESMARP
jgi:hypothetical protein